MKNKNLNTDIIIRKAIKKDIPELVECHKLFMQHHINVDKRFSLRKGAKEKWQEQIFEAIENRQTLVLAAELNKTIVGCAYIIIKSGAADFGPEKLGYLCDVFVKPEFRHRGISKRFLLSAQNWLKKKEINTIEASWSVHSIEARETWPSLGFVPMSVSGQLIFK